MPSRRAIDSRVVMTDHDIVSRLADVALDVVRSMRESILEGRQGVLGCLFGAAAMTEVQEPNAVEDSAVCRYR